MVRNILMTNVRINGESLAEDGIDDIMVFTNLTPEQLQAAYRHPTALLKVEWDDCYEVKDEEVQYYLYEACHLTEKEEARALELAAG